MNKEYSPSNSVKTTKRIFEIIQVIQDYQPVEASTIAEEIDISRTQVYNHLNSLEKLEYVVKDHGSYRLSLRFMNHGMVVREEFTLSGLINEHLENLVEKTSETAWYAVEEHGWAINVDNLVGDEAVETPYLIGDRLHLHSTASGKALLSKMPIDSVDDYVADTDLPEITENTIIDEDTLRDELEQIRRTNIAYNFEESQRGLHSIASPIVQDDELYGAVSLSGNATRLSKNRIEDELTAELIETVNALELQIEFRQ